MAKELRMLKSDSWDVYHCETCEFHFAVLVTLDDDELASHCPICNSKEPDFVGARNTDMSKQETAWIDRKYSGGKA